MEEQTRLGVSSAMAAIDDSAAVKILVDDKHCSPNCPFEGEEIEHIGEYVPMATPSHLRRHEELRRLRLFFHKVLFQHKNTPVVKAAAHHLAERLPSHKSRTEKLRHVSALCNSVTVSVGHSKIDAEIVHRPDGFASAEAADDYAVLRQYGMTLEIVHTCSIPAAVTAARYYAVIHQLYPDENVGLDTSRPAEQHFEPSECVPILHYDPNYAHIFLVVPGNSNRDVSTVQIAALELKILEDAQALLSAAKGLREWSQKPLLWESEDALQHLRHLDEIKDDIIKMDCQSQSALLLKDIASIVESARERQAIGTAEA